MPSPEATRSTTCALSLKAHTWPVGAPAGCAGVGAEVQTAAPTKSASAPARQARTEAILAGFARIIPCDAEVEGVRPDRGAGRAERVLFGGRAASHRPHPPHRGRGRARRPGGADAAHRGLRARGAGRL